MWYDQDYRGRENIYIYIYAIKYSYKCRNSHTLCCWVQSPLPPPTSWLLWTFISSWFLSPTFWNLVILFLLDFWSYHIIIMLFFFCFFLNSLVCLFSFKWLETWTQKSKKKKNRICDVNISPSWLLFRSLIFLGLFPSLRKVIFFSE